MDADRANNPCLLSAPVLRETALFPVHRDNNRSAFLAVRANLRGVARKASNRLGMQLSPPPVRCRCRDIHGVA